VTRNGAYMINDGPVSFGVRHRRQLILAFMCG
jgi:hypothetical protein